MITTAGKLPKFSFW